MSITAKSYRCLSKNQGKGHIDWIYRTGKKIYAIEEKQINIFVRN
jgi:hypothetical protein